MHQEPFSFSKSHFEDNGSSRGNIFFRSLSKKLKAFFILLLSESHTDA